MNVGYTTKKNWYYQGKRTRKIQVYRNYRLILNPQPHCCTIWISHSQSHHQSRTLPATSTCCRTSSNSSSTCTKPFKPLLQTVIDAAINGQLDGIPFFSKPALVRRYLTPLPATPKGRMKCPKQGTRSTHPKPKKSKRAPATSAQPVPQPPPTAQPSAPEVDCHVIAPNHAVNKHILL